MGRAIAAIALSVLMFTGGLAGASYNTLAQSVKRMALADGVCTAWATAPERYVTAGHCTGFGATIGGLPATLLRVDEEHDLALYAVVGDTAPGLPLATRAPRIGDHVVTIGYPHGIPNALITVGHIGGGSLPGLTGALITDAPSAPGASGGPYLVNGRVVGVLTAGTQVPALTLGTALKDLKEFLQK